MTIFRRIKNAAMALIGTACLAGGLWALPVSVEYPGTQGALAAPNAFERDTLERINQDRKSHGLPALHWHAMLSGVAREQAEDMAQYERMEYASPHLGTFDYRLHRSGIPVANARYSIFRLGSVNELMVELQKSGFHREDATDIGMGIVSKGFLPRHLYVAIITCERASTLDRFPTQPLSNRRYRLAGSIAAGLKNPQVIITSPEGDVTSEALTTGPNGQYETTVAFNRGPGKYSVEVTAEGRLGPTMLDLMHCYAGVPYPGPMVLKSSVQTPVNLRAAERTMADLINKARLDAHLAALQYDDSLAEVARQHSYDMLQHHYFAHTSPTQGDLGARMEKAGLKGKRFTENLANNQSLDEANNGLLASPGHRRNILDPEVTRVGVGIARGEDGQLLITENFLCGFSMYNADAVAAQFFAALNTTRETNNAGDLTSSPLLARIAEQNSQAMMEAGKVGYTRAQELMDKEKLPYKSVQMAVFQTTEILKPEQVDEALKGKYAEIGIGITQNTTSDGQAILWTTVLLGEK